MKQINGFIIVSLFITTAYFIGILQFLGDFENGKCEMTYMFESIQFVRIANKADAEYGRYGLYAYSEGRLTEKARKMYFDGIPVLFIPGNAGSHKQVRSLASIALRKTINSRFGFHFNYFTVDLNNEFSALSGSLLYDQMLYVNHSISRILQLYEKQYSRPKSIILVGHSMGGIIAEYLISTLPLDSNLVPILIKLSTPTSRPLLQMDYYTKLFYDDLHKTNISESNTTIISVFGGYNDFLIPAHLVKGNNLQVSTTHIPKAWLSTDHLSILWCKQVILAINRALFDSVDYRTKQITVDRNVIVSAFKHHLVQHSGKKFVAGSVLGELPATSISDRGDWFETLYRQYTDRHLNGTRNVRWNMIRLTSMPQHEWLTVVALNMKTPDWVYACPAVGYRDNMKVCNEGVHLTQLSEIAPSAKYKRRILTINMHELMKDYTRATHIVTRILPTTDPVVLHFDIYSSSDRTTTITLPPWYSIIKKTQVAISTEGAISYTLQLPQLSHIVQYYQLYVEPIRCSAQTYHATASLIVPWGSAENGVGGEEQHEYFTEIHKKPLGLRVFNSRPKNMANQNATVRLTLDPTCTFSISIKPSLMGTFGQISRYYSLLLVANVAVVVLMTFRRQMVGLGKDERCSIFFTAIAEGAKPYYIVTVVKLSTNIFSYSFFRDFIPTSDWQILNDEDNDFVLLPILMFVVSVGLTWMLALGLSIGIVFFESTCNKVTLKFLSKTILGFSTWSDYVMNGMKKLPGIVAIFLIFLSYSTCGALALCLATGFYFLKLTQMSQDCIESFVWKVAKLIGKRLKTFLSNKFQRRTSSQAATPSQEVPVIEGTSQPETSETIEPPKKTKADLEVKVVSKGNAKSDESVDKIERVVENDSDSDDSSKENAPVNAEQIGKDAKIITEDDKKNKSVVVENIADDAEIQTLLEQDADASSDNVAEQGVSQENQSIYSSWLNELLENNEIYFHFSIFLLYFLVTLLNLPSVLTWAHNFRYMRILNPDPSLIPGLMLSICAFPLWHLELPKESKRGFLQLSYVLYAAAFLSLSYCSLSIYRLSYILSSVVVIIVLHQLFAPKKEEIEDNNDDDKPQSFMENLKKKWE